MKKVRALERAQIWRLAGMQDKFDGRDQGFKLTTTDYQRVQRRLLVFLVVENISETFLDTAGFRAPSKAVDDLLMAPSTASTYWVAITAAAKAVGMVIPDATKVDTWLNHISEMNPPARPSLTLEELHLAAGSAPPHVKDAMFLSFLMGQRLGDVLLLQQRSISVVQNTLQRKSSCCVTFYEGKTVGLTGVYTLHIPIVGEAANIMIRAQERSWENLFVPPGEIKETVRAEANLQIGDVRALRRGGLQMMALMEVPLDEILLFSRHQSVKMLYKYLQYGTVLMHQANTTERIVGAINTKLANLAASHPELVHGLDE